MLKRLFLLATVSSVVACSGNPTGPEQIDTQAATKQFETLVDKFEAFMETEPIYIEKSFDPKKEEQIFFYATKYILTTDLEYDIKESDSVLYPLVADLQFKVKNPSNNSCGDLLAESAGLAHSTAQLAAEATCFDRPLENTIIFTFGYQEQQWKLNAATFNDGDETRFEKYFEGPYTNVKYNPEEPTRKPKVTPEDGAEAYAINQKWQELFKP